MLFSAWWLCVCKSLFSMQECEKCLLIHAHSFMLSLTGYSEPTFLLLSHIHMTKNILFVSINYATIKARGKQESKTFRVLLKTALF